MRTRKHAHSCACVCVRESSDLPSSKCRDHETALHIYVFARCSVLQCVAVSCSVWRCVAVCCSELYCVAVCCVAAWCSVVQKCRSHTRVLLVSVFMSVSVSVSLSVSGVEAIFRFLRSGVDSRGKREKRVRGSGARVGRSPRN